MILPYIISFFTLLCAELAITLNSFYVIKGNKHLTALTGAVASALWCVKIVVILDQPLTIITSFVGTYVGTIFAFYVNKKYLSK